MSALGYPWTGLSQHATGPNQQNKALYDAFKVFASDRITPVFHGCIRRSAWLMGDLHYDIEMKADVLTSYVFSIAGATKSMQYRHFYVCASKVTGVTFTKKVQMEKGSIVAAAKDAAEEMEELALELESTVATRHDSWRRISSAFDGECALPHSAGGKLKKAWAALDMMPGCRSASVFGTAWGAATAVAYACDFPRTRSPATLRASVFGEEASIKRRVLGMPF